MKKILTVLLSLAMVFSFFSCGSDENNSGKKRRKSESDTTAVNSSDEQYKNDESEKFYDSSKAQKLGTCNWLSYSYYDAETGMRGIISVDGKKDTGPIFYDCNPVPYSEKHVTARTKKIETPSNLDSVNSVALIDYNANTLVDGFFSYELLTDRFYVVGKAVALNESGQSLSEIDASNILDFYDVEYYVYDTKEDKIVDNVKSHSDSFRAAGAFINYTDENNNEKTINVNGHQVPEDARFVTMMTFSNHGMHENGYYKIVENHEGKVYNENNDVVYTFNTDDENGYGYEPSSMQNGYVLASNTHKVGNAYYTDFVLLDESFTPISAEVTLVNSSQHGINLFYKLFAIQDIQNEGPFRLYDSSGKLIYEATDGLSSTTANSHRDLVDYFLLADGELDLIVSQNGEIIYQGTGEAHAEFDHTTYSAYRQIGEERYYYCVKDGDFTVKTDSTAYLGRFLVEVNEDDGTKSVVDLRTGEKIITGYYDYYGKAVDDNSYILAYYKNNTSDMFLIER